MAPKILILTELGDVHAYAVAAALRQRHADVVLWHTTDFPTQLGETIRFEGGRRTVSIRGPALEVNDFQFDTVWCRRPSLALDERVLHPADRRFAETECCIFRRSLFSLLGLDSFWVNPPDAALRAGRKPFQQQVASEVGFSTPATVYTNDPQEIRSFLGAYGEVVYKPFRGTSWSDGKSSWVPYTSLIREEILVGDDLLRAVPGIYQECVAKAYELRVTVIGRKIFAAKIDSQCTRLGSLDWRRADDDLRIEAYDLPFRVSEQCLRVMERLGLVFGCFDLIVTPNGEFVFLEVNDMGQFLFVERVAGIPLLDAFTSCLMQSSADFEWNTEDVVCRYADMSEIVVGMEAEFRRRHVPPRDRAVRETRQSFHRRRRVQVCGV